ncbi:MAG: beta strand repeat-containing protein [Thermomicrobiales bacterium]
MRFGLQRGRGAMATLLLLALLFPLLSAPVVSAAALTVANVNDSGPGSLRDAITQANDGSGALITFAVSGTISLASPLPHIAASMTIDGTGAPTYAGMPVVTIDGNNGGTVFTTNPGTDVRLRGLTIQHGMGGAGGGVLNNGTLTLDASTLLHNGTPAGGSGGGIYNGGTLTVTASTISQNSAGSGGGIFSAGTLRLNASTVDTNTATGLGGGVLIAGGHAQTITNSTIAGNHGAAGGGIDNQGNLALANSTVADNVATVTDGGGIKAEAQGISVTATNTIIAANTHSGPDDVAGTFSSGGHNLIGDADGATGFTAPGDQTGTAASPRDAMLGPLMDNGGPTQTIALAPGSPAIGTGDPAVCAAAPVSGLDQRGFPRAPACAIGAFDVQRTVTRIAVTMQSPPTVVIGETKQLTAIATYADSSTQDVTTSATWSSNAPTLATVVSGFTNANPGQVTGIAIGSATITARFGTQADSALLAINDPVPNMTGFTPATATATSGTSTLTVNGSNFVPTSQIFFNTTGLTTAYVSASQVNATVPSGLLTTPGTASITVVNPAPGGGTSNVQPLTITAGAVTTFVLSGFPATTTAGVPHTLTVTAKDGAGNTATVYNGTVYFSSSDFAAAVPSITLANGIGSAAVTLKTAGTQSIAVRDISSPAIVGMQSGIVVTPGAAASVTANPGTTPQSAKVGSAYAAPLAVTVRDAFGNPVGGASVLFAAPTSGASGAFTGSATVTTNPSGMATAPAFTANTTAGAYTVTATVTGAATTATFAMTNLPGPPGGIVATTGTPQSAAVGGTFALPFTALVKDSGGNPVAAGVSVTFTTPASGAGGTFVGGGATATALTVAGGVATSPAFKANAVAGAYSVVASAPGVALAALFSLTNTAGPPAAIAPVSGGSQSAPITTTFPTALAARVTDAMGNPVSGATVTFAAPSSRASGAFAGGVSTATTNAAGIATAPAFTANTTAGSYVVTASVAGVSGTVAFSLVNTPGPVAAFAFSSLASSGKTGAARTATTMTTQAGTPLTVTVTTLDTAGNVATNYTGAVHFTSSDPQAVVPANYTFTNSDAGVHGFTVTLKSAGAQSVTISDTSNSAAVGTVSIAVSAAPAPVTVTPPPAATSASPAPTNAGPVPTTPPTSERTSTDIPYLPPAPPTTVVGPVPIADPFAALSSPTTAPQCRFFAETHHSLCFGFFGYWQQHGGTALFGMPISEEFQERGADGTMRTVQYLERARFEYHPEFRGTVYEVELGLLAQELADTRTGDAPFAPIDQSGVPTAARFYSETGHSLADPFAANWDTNGGLPVFGFPISEPFQERNADTGQTYLVQYFERYRLEFHPETNGIELGRLGVQDAQMRGYLPR